MEIEYTCPLGHKCETAKDNKLYRCRWYIKVQGKNPQNEELLDEFRCAYEWGVMLQIENTQRVNQLGASIESFRNEMVNQNTNFITGLQNVINKKLS